MKGSPAFALNTKADDLEFGTVQKVRKSREKHWQVDELLGTRQPGQLPTAQVLPSELYEITIELSLRLAAPLKVPTRKRSR